MLQRVLCRAGCDDKRGMGLLKEKKEGGRKLDLFLFILFPTIGRVEIRRRRRKEGSVCPSGMLVEGGGRKRNLSPLFCYRFWRKKGRKETTGPAFRRGPPGEKGKERKGGVSN